MDLNDIFKNSELLQFWPNASQGPRQRVSATARFIIYAVCLFYIISRDVRIFALGAVALAILYYVWKTQLSSPESGISYYTAPTIDNSMANPVPGDAMNLPGAAWYPSVRDKVQDAWSQIHPFESIRNAERNFYTVPEHDQGAFATAAFGKPFEPKCNDQGGLACNPDRFYSTFPERPQMRGGN